LLSDTGVYHYRESPERSYCRSTAAHSTVRIDTEDQSEVWKSFRVGRRASSLICELRIESGITIFHAAHDGYTGIGRHMYHERFMMVGGEWICVADVLHGEGRHLIENIIHFHPGVTVKREKAGLAIASPGGGHARLHPATDENTRVFDTDFYPAFGSRRSRKTVVFHAHRTFPCVSAYSIVFAGTPPELLPISGTRELRYRLPDGREISLESAL